MNSLLRLKGHTGQFRAAEAGLSSSYEDFTDAAIQSKYERDPAAIGKAMISGTS